MNPLIESNLPRLRQLCEKYNVARLELFGSATTDQWDPARSDFDFLVVFGAPPAKLDLFDQYMDFLFALEKLLGRHVDLVEESAMRNPYFIRRVNESRRPVYVAA